MRRFQRVVVIAFLVIAAHVPVAVAQDAATPSRPTLTPAQIEEFLLRAKILRTRPAGTGVTNSLRATLSDGNLTHDAQIQVIDQAKPVFRPATGPPEFSFTDSYRFNIAGYRLAVLLGLDNVPVSVERSFGGKGAAFTWWIDDVMMDEKERTTKVLTGPDPERTAMQVHIMRVFDELIQNRDRNTGNLLWTTDWKMWLIDHTRAFRTGDDLLKPDLLQRVERSLFEKMKGLTADGLAKTAKGSLHNYEIAPLLKRRDLIVKQFEARIAERGEGRVLYALPR
jgi:hypothetical protein